MMMTASAIKIAFKNQDLLSNVPHAIMIEVSAFSLYIKQLNVTLRINGTIDFVLKENATNHGRLAQDGIFRSLTEIQ